MAAAAVVLVAAVVVVVVAVLAMGVASVVDVKTITLVGACVVDFLLVTDNVVEGSPAAAKG